MTENSDRVTVTDSPSMGKRIILTSKMCFHTFLVDNLHIFVVSVQFVSFVLGQKLCQARFHEGPLKFAKLHEGSTRVT